MTRCAEVSRSTPPSPSIWGRSAANGEPAPEASDGDRRLLPLGDLSATVRGYTVVMTPAVRCVLPSLSKRGVRDPARCPRQRGCTGGISTDLQLRTDESMTREASCCSLTSESSRRRARPSGGVHRMKQSMLLKEVKKGTANQGHTHSRVGGELYGATVLCSTNPLHDQLCGIGTFRAAALGRPGRQLSAFPTPPFTRRRRRARPADTLLGSHGSRSFLSTQASGDGAILRLSAPLYGARLLRRR